MNEVSGTTDIQKGMRRTVVLDQWGLGLPGADRGLGRYARQLREAAAGLPDWNVVELARGDAPGYRRLGARLRELSESGKIVYHSTTPFHLPLRKQLPWVSSIQDTIPLDLKAYQRMGIRTRLAYNNAKRADAIFANSQYTAQRIEERMGIPSDRIAIGSLPVSSVFFREDVSQRVEHPEPRSRPYVVGLADMRTPDPRKRYKWIDDLAKWLRSAGISTVVTGRGLSAEQFPYCEVIGPKNDAQLAALYAGAVAFFYPSAYEGQGLPPLEAMATGCPVFAFANSSITEMVGDGGFLLEDPAPWETQVFDEPLPAASAAEVTSKIVSIVHDGGALREIRDRGRERARALTWEAFRAGLSRAYETADES
ncbi:glycosyltransferase [Sinomonas sp. R1AF57]|uniref:glycosyltransferase n=1 Tax=Sinomonas sp. R1AF57 TaxID=2020377 RepID=UPI000B5E6A85|nr:glycosyltransferase [Sinomonas sp. R1AF57]ASN52586.1 hypothetical protein CGQ25_11280 [Sinomonas sp. R1AF57]